MTDTAAPRVPLECRGYAALGTGNYTINHSRAGEPAELVICFATEADKSGNRQVGESRDNPPDAPPIPAEDMVIRIAFTSERGLFALEDQLAWVRKVHFPASAPALAARVAELDAEVARLREALRELLNGWPRGHLPETAKRGYRALGDEK